MFQIRSSGTAKNFGTPRTPRDHSLTGREVRCDLIDPVTRVVPVIKNNGSNQDQTSYSIFLVKSG